MVIMYKKYVLALLVCFFSAVLVANAQAPARKIDTTMKFGKSGYRVTCTNKNADKNSLGVKLINFEKEAGGDFTLDIKGRLLKTEVDDVNRDGFPDLILYISPANDTMNKIQLVAIASEANTSLSPIVLPDIYDDPKLRNGYKGNDSFFLMEGNLIRRFPLVPGEGVPAAAANGNLIRQVQYTVTREERGYKFRVVRTYDFTK
jgi:hypothetical protein